MSLTDPGPPLKLSCDHGLRRPAIVATLLGDVIEGRLPAGRRLVTQQLAGRFGVSHTPVREALIALAGLGLVDLQPNRGAVVRRVTPRDVREVCQVRRVLECEAVKRACGRVEVAALRALTDGLNALLAAGPSSDSARYIDQARALDSKLHDLIADSCGNAFLTHELTRLTTLFRAFRDAAWARVVSRQDFRRIAGEAREHLAVVDALTAADPRAAARAMSRHVMAGGTYWQRVIRAARLASPEPESPEIPTPTTEPRPRRAPRA